MSSSGESLGGHGAGGRAVIVQKYGGSSVADVDKIGRVAEKVAKAKREGHDVVVVVSAMGKTTDGLVELAKKVAGDHEPPRRELDMLVSTGERVTMALLSIALESRGVPAISFTGSQSGIITNDRHFDARIIEVRPHRIEDELARGRVVIVAGYQGMSYRREITTLGRGGSDTTAVALAAALGAARCEIYSDVDGVYTADPRSVPEATHLPELDLQTLAEMAECGAKVVNAQAVEWARKNKVAIVARKTSDAEGARETLAHGEEPKGAIAIVGQSRVVRLQGTGTELVAAAHEAQVPLYDVMTDGRTTTAVVPLLNLPDWERAKRTLLALAPTTVVEEDLALVSVVGTSLNGPDARLLRAVAVLRDLGVAPRQTFAGPLRIGFLVASSTQVALEQALHRTFVT